MNTIVQGSVTLSISELDNLRKQIENLRIEKDYLIKHSKEVKLNVIVSSETGDCSVSQSSYIDRYKGRELLPYTNYWVVRDSVEYIGLDDVIREIKKEQEVKVIEKLGNLERQVNSLKTKEQELITEQSKIVENLKKKHEDKFTSLHEQYKTEVEKLRKEIQLLKNPELINTSSEKIIEDLKLQVSKLHNRNFWHYLFGIKL